MQKRFCQKQAEKLSPIYVFQSKINSLAIYNAIEVLKKGWVGLGKEVKKFEIAFAEYCGAKYCVAVSSATAALNIVYKYINVRDELILTTPLTFVSTNSMLLVNDAKIVFGNYDHNTLSFNIGTVKSDIDQITKHIFPYDCDYIVAVSYGGLPISKKDIIEMGENKIVINDFAHCAGAEYEDGTKVGSIGPYNIFSFHAVKNLPSPDGGAIVTDSEEVYAFAKKFRWLGIDKDTVTRTNDSHNGSYSWKYNVDLLGDKCHMNDLTAAILLGQLETLDKDNVRRQQIFNYYKANIDKDIGRIVPNNKGPRTKSSYHMSVLVLSECINRSDFIFLLKQKWNIHPGVHYQHNNEFEIFKGAFNINSYGDFWKRLVTLPCHLEMTDEDVERVVVAVNSWESSF